mgnify:CR=1 FL=1
MRNDMRPELSQKNPYWIGKHRYYELKHFCLQSPIWKKARLALDGLSRRPADLQVFVSCGQVKGDPTERCAQSRLFFAERMEMVEQFQNPQNQVSVFCISLKAGGTGLNMTAADIVIHYDPWWNKAAQNQATDRAHRIGQKHAINVYQLIAEETIEQKICELQQVKEDLAEEVLSGEGISSTQFNKDEIMNLLEK